jgi:ABC-type multidrug transport system fused ATPase/permease subunit
MSGAILAVPEPKGRRSERLRELGPDLWALVRPRRYTMLLGLGLIAIGRIAGLVAPLQMKRLVDDVLNVKDPAPGKLLQIVLTILAASTVQGVAGFIMTQVFTRSTQRMITELRCKLQAHVLRLPVSYHEATKTGTLASRVMNDVLGLQSLVGPTFLQFIGSLMTSALALAFMIRVSARMTIIGGLAILFFSVTIGRRTGRVRKNARERTEIYANISGRLTESLGGVRVVKGYHAEEREEAAFKAGNLRFQKNILETVTFTSSLGLASTLLGGFAGAAVMYVGARQIKAGEMTQGDFFTYLLLLSYLVAPLLLLTTVGTAFTEALAGIERSRDIFRQPIEDADPKRTVTLGPVKGEVVLEDVGFAYEPGKQVLDHFSLHAMPGTVTALVGPSGSGKSTTIGLIASFYNPTEGRVTVDGVDLSTVRLESFRAQLGVVLQETFLFDGTILENVAFARPGATEEEILAACRTARVDEFVETFEKGYQTPVGERGVKLSGGQRQRISIARAILANPRILILDEATSSLDSQSEALIQEGLAYLLKGRTTFVIAHRLSTIRRADQILVVDHGRIVERGTHAELLAGSGLYHDMYTRQHQVEENLFLAPGEGGPAEEAEAKPTVEAPREARIALLPFP